MNLNLRFITPACRRLGIHLHVCEVGSVLQYAYNLPGLRLKPTLQVQLLLKEFATLKNAAGHKRYVAFRNARGR